jgi:hypothetical protein
VNASASWLEMSGALVLPPERTDVYLAPPCGLTQQGVERRVGLELEFGGVDVAGAQAAIQETLGGQVERLSPTNGRVRGTPYGDFGVELDSTLFRERSYVDSLKNIGMDVDQDEVLGKAEELVLRFVREFVPCEVVTPPIPCSKLAALDALWRRLHELGAQGTHAAWHYGFGLHLNPEVTENNPRGVLGPLKAFLLLEPWLVEQGRTALARRIGPFIRPFPREYRELVLELDYWPEWPGLIEDYLRYNPTRDRPLDLLPLLVEIDPEGVRARVENPHLVKGRPTFHYRLPNCEIDEPDWSPADEWNRWVLVERLADNPAALEELCQRFKRLQAGFSLIDPWPDELNSWLAACPREVIDP